MRLSRRLLWLADEASRTPLILVLSRDGDARAGQAVGGPDGMLQVANLRCAVGSCRLRPAPHMDDLPSPA